MNRHTLVSVLLGFASVVALTSASCRIRATDCDYTVTRCKTVCDWVCDGPPGYGCFFNCYDDCWDDCYVYDRPAPTYDAATASDAGAALPSADAGGVALCAPCTSNDECGSGGLCIQPGADAGPRFCGRGCTTGDSCPAGFVCSAIGKRKQCLPASGTCP